MKVVYPGPMEAFIIDDVTILRGDEADLTAEQFKRAQRYGVLTVEEAPPPEPEPDGLPPMPEGVEDTEEKPRRAVAKK